MVLKILKKIKEFFKEEEKEEEISMPYEYLVLDYNQQSKEYGLYDEGGLIIKRFVGGALERVYPYSESLFNALTKVSKLPYYDATQYSDDIEINDETDSTVLMEE